jgi:hypothetical protein
VVEFLRGINGLLGILATMATCAAKRKRDPCFVSGVGSAISIVDDHSSGLGEILKERRC